MKKIAIIMGSDSDLPKLQPAIDTLAELGVSPALRVISAHRTPEQAHEFSKTARDNGFGVIIAAAGMAAHLAGVLAASTTLPVIGIPIASGALAGKDALYSTVMMPPGVPVATVGIDGAKNAALLAVQILAVDDAELTRKLTEYKKGLAEKVIAADKKINSQN
ncbi:MAG: 5-(carboxyamino)imidazole ribonucleotide mutase [Oscillospiraceae bacterium]|jgi:5-(carboxyamino)imidazole ribonucleotide mutase|nr:5-(carboxyamino)imidazole ribonucleotide mutase [Oscillospiraceae bacterium]